MSHVMVLHWDLQVSLPRAESGHIRKFTGVHRQDISEGHGSSFACTVECFQELHQQHRRGSLPGTDQAADSGPLQQLADVHQSQDLHAQSLLPGAFTFQ